MDVSWRSTGVTRGNIGIRSDPCDDNEQCRSGFLITQYKCPLVASQYTMLRQLDCTLTWGLNQGIAVVGGANRPEHTVHYESYNI